MCIPLYTYYTIVLDVVANAIYARNVTCRHSLLIACPSPVSLYGMGMRRGSVICKCAYEMNKYIHIPYT